MYQKFPPAILDQPLLLRNPRRIQEKLASASGLLKEYWEDYRTRLLADAELRPELVYLPAAFEAGPEREEAAAALRTYWRSLAQGDTFGDVQFHTWCRGGAVTRRVAFFDWLAAAGCWSAEDVAEAAEAFVGFAFKHSFMTLNSRRRASDNQVWSMALNAAVIGFVFGYKRGAHPTARFLFDYGTGRLPDIIGLFPGDGYGGEGSTYTSHVNTPLACWTAELLRHVLGKSMAKTPFAPNGTTLLRLVEMELHLLSPGGLLAPWDHYGWQPGVNASAFAFLARLTGNPKYLSVIPALKLWEPKGYLAWGADDHLWTLLWWPDDFKDYNDRALPEELFGWFLPHTGAALDDCPRRSRLLQVWDLSSDTIAGVGRGQVNPNHLIFEYGGEPVFQDGILAKDAPDPWKLPPAKVLGTLSPSEQERYRKYRESIGAGEADWARILSGLTPGLIAAANSVVIDDELWYWPGARRTGTAEFYARTPALQAVTGNAAAYYQPHYDVSLVRRSTLWTEAGFGLVLDTLEAATPHKWTAQFYTRPGLEIEANSARLRLTNGNGILFAWAPGPDAKVTTIEGYPATHELRSRRLTLTQRGPKAQFTLLIAPGARTAVLARRGNRVVVTIDGTQHEFIVENFDLAPEKIAGKETYVAFAWAQAGNLALLAANKAGKAAPDVLIREDITMDRDLQVPMLPKLLRWQVDEPPLATTPLGRLDGCLAELATPNPNLAVLLAALESDWWPVRIAAIEVIGRRRRNELTSRLRQMLAAEHAIPEAELYPPDSQTGEAAGKRWRLKTALIVGLGRLRDAEAVPLLAQILRDNRDFYPVYSVAAQALGRIGGAAALEALGPALEESEINTRDRATFARDLLASQAKPAARV